MKILDIYLILDDPLTHWTAAIRAVHGYIDASFKGGVSDSN